MTSIFLNTVIDFGSLSSGLSLLDAADDVICVLLFVGLSSVASSCESMRCRRPVFCDLLNSPWSEKPDPDLANFGFHVLRAAERGLLLLSTWLPFPVGFLAALWWPYRSLVAPLVPLVVPKTLGQTRTRMTRTVVQEYEVSYLDS